MQFFGRCNQTRCFSFVQSLVKHIVPGIVCAWSCLFMNVVSIEIGVKNLNVDLDDHQMIPFYVMVICVRSVKFHHRSDFVMLETKL